MERDELFLQHAKAMALGNIKQASAINQEISDDDRSSQFIFTAAFFGGLITEHFGADLDPGQLKAFVSALVDNSENAEPGVKAEAAEGCVRAIYGEGELLDDLELDDQAVAMWAMIREIAANSETLRQNIDEHLREALSLAQEAEDEDLDEDPEEEQDPDGRD